MKENLLPDEAVISKIYLLRGQKVMLDKDLAELYGVSTSNLNRAVKRNISRFPEDFMFQLNKEEFDNLIFQYGTSSWGGTRKLPFAFTEQGVAMLSGVLHSDRAVAVNIQIIRVFTKLRSMMLTHKDLLIKMNELESRIQNHDKSIKQIFQYLRKLIAEDSTPKKAIGFKLNKK